MDVYPRKILQQAYKGERYFKCNIIDLYGLFVYCMYSLFETTSRKKYPKNEKEFWNERILNFVLLLKILLSHQQISNNKVEV